MCVGICLCLSAPLWADMADICHLSSSNLTALIIIIPPLASPLVLFPSIATKHMHHTRCISYFAAPSFHPITLFFLLLYFFFTLFSNINGATTADVVYYIHYMRWEIVLAMSCGYFCMIFLLVCIDVLPYMGRCVREHLQRDQP